VNAPSWALIFNLRMDYDEDVMMNELERLKGLQVELIYNGITFRGLLIGASGEEVYLKTTLESVTLPMSGITIVRKAPEP